MANTYSPQLQFVKPTPADPLSQNTWGGLLNTTIDLVDSAVAGILTKSVAGGVNVVLTSNQGAADEERHQHFVCIGVMTGDVCVLFPSGRTKTFSVFNGTTGAFNLTIGVNNGSSLPLGTTALIPAAASVELVSDGTDVSLRADFTGMASGDLSGSYPSPTVVATHLTLPLPISQGGIGAGSFASAGLAPLVGVAFLANTQTFTKGQRGAAVLLTDAGSTAIDLGQSNNFAWALTGSSHVLVAPSNASVGQSGIITVTPIGGTFAPSFTSQYVAVGGVATLVFSAADGVTDLLPYYVIDESHIFLSQPLLRPTH